VCKGKRVQMRVQRKAKVYSRYNPRKREKEVKA
jgi:hypothetical protein